MHPLAAAILGLACAAAAPQAPSPPLPSPPASGREPKLDRYQWAKDVDGPQPITAVEVRNDFGDIRARRAEDRRLEASMVVQRLDEAGDRVGFTVERRGPVVALVVAYPPGRVKDADPSPRKDSYDRLDLVVFVPRGVTLRARTLRGQVEVRGLASDVEAATLDGPVFVRASGAVQARTGGGELRVMLDEAALGRDGPPILLQSASGPITLTLPPRGEPDLRVSTGGALESKLRLRRRQAGGRTEATLAGTGRLVVVNSAGGRVLVEREEPALFR
jgi:hypothetical protein